MTNILLQPVEVVRDPYGYWVHPDIDKALKTADEEFATKEEWSLFKQEQNIETATTYFESDAPADLVKRYVDGEYDASEWNPTMPDGEGWFMLSINDTEDMPVCVWARRKEPFIPVDILNQFKHEMISHGYGSFYSFDTFENGNLKENSTKTLLIGWRVGHAERVKLKADIDQIASDKQALVVAICEFRAIFAELLKCNMSEDPEDYKMLFDATVCAESSLNRLVGTNNEFWASRERKEASK